MILHPQAAPASPQAAASAASAAEGAIDEAAIKTVGDEIRTLKDRLKGEGMSGSKINRHPEIAELVKKLQTLKKGG